MLAEEPLHLALTSACFCSDEQPLEQILDARVTTSACEGCACAGEDCGGQGENASCRALEIDGRLHEALDEALLRRALDRYLALSRPGVCSSTKLDDGASSACC